MIKTIIIINLIIIVWLLLKYRHESKLDNLRDYDRMCKVEAERKAREER